MAKALVRIVGGLLNQNIDQMNYRKYEPVVSVLGPVDVAIHMDRELKGGEFGA